MPNVRVETSFQINSGSLGNIYSLLKEIKQSLWKAGFGGIFLAFHVIKPTMRLPAMELQYNHRKADKENQAGFGGYGGVFYSSMWHKTIFRGNTVQKYRA